ncbi:MAG: TatD family hydrolase [Candidatus Omnitrophica bacterium]|nr:TatD family hydrolase [Candidatus Omnitrophota bacterium]
MMKYLDTHCHLDFPEFDSDRHQVIQIAREEGVLGIINVGTNLASTKSCLRLAREYPSCFATAGIHPHYAPETNPDERKQLALLAREERIVAIGETGLDFHYGKDYAKKQEDLFRYQLELAGELSLPLVIHQRECPEEIISIIEKVGYSGPLVFHCFDGNQAIMNYVREKKFFCSFTGIVTFPKAQNTREAAASLPLSLIMVETDAPYLSPHPFRGKRNEPAKVRLVAEAVAACQNHSREVTAEILLRNSVNFFRLTEKGLFL